MFRGRPRGYLVCLSHPWMLPRLPLCCVHNKPSFYGTLHCAFLDPALCLRVTSRHRTLLSKFSCGMVDSISKYTYRAVGEIEENLFSLSFSWKANGDKTTVWMTRVCDLVASLPHLEMRWNQILFLICSPEWFPMRYVQCLSLSTRWQRPPLSSLMTPAVEKHIFDPSWCCCCCCCAFSLQQAKLPMASSWEFNLHSPESLLSAFQIKGQLLFMFHCFTRSTKCVHFVVRYE